jgi:DNA-binding LacI/PurR family transcriptional regulator
MQFVSMDDRAAGKVITEAAFAGARSPLVLSLPFVRGQQPALLVGPDPEDAAYPVTRNRLAGARDWCLAAGVPWDTVRVAVLSRNSQVEAVATISGLLAAPGAPDAIMAMSDELAFGALTAARERGVAVPDQLSITGWDGSGAATLAGLTTIEQSLYDQGRALTRAVLDPGVEVPEPAWTLVRRATSRP